ncbi:MAG TPA: hypothetical protein VMH22_12700 [bacterium]|nr:hypothetical protein [bacterium]
MMAVPALADTTWVVCGVPDAENIIPFCGHSTDAMRFQALYLHDELGFSGEIVAFGLGSPGNPAAEFYNVRVSLCQTTRTSLDTVFANNYDGNTPDLVFQADTLLVGTPDTWYYFPCSFMYDNTRNLIFEIQWRDDAGSTVNFYRSVNGVDPRRAWKVGNDTAAIGQTDLVQAYYARVGFLPTGVAEGGKMRVAEPSLDVRPSIGHDFAIRCAAAVGSRVGIEVLDVSGRAVAKFSREPGRAVVEAVWHADRVSAGIYLVRVTVAGRTSQRQVVVTVP